MNLSASHLSPKNNQAAANIIAARDEVISRHLEGAARPIFSGKDDIMIGHEVDPDSGGKKHKFAIIVSGPGTGQDDNRAKTLVAKLKDQGFKDVENISYDNHAGSYTAVIVKGSPKELAKTVEEQQISFSSKGR